MTNRPKRKGISLAVPADEKKVRNFGQEFYIQPKLNGERGVVDEFHNEPIILSSYENSFEFLDIIKTEIRWVWNMYKIPIPFDGEIYVHGWSRERIDSALRRTVNYNPEVVNLEYHVFDLKLPIPQEKRLYLLNEIFKKIEEYQLSTGFLFTKLKLVPTYKATPENWMEYADHFLTLGYEGAILRKPSYDTYYEGRTVKQMLKYKPTEIDEYVIIDTLEAISKEGKPKGMIGSFTVKSHDGVDLFNVGAGKLSHQERIELWEKRLLLIGKVLITKQGKIKTSTGVPTCAVAVEIKDA